MSITSLVVDPLLNLHGTPAYALVGALTFGEAAVFAGFVVPGETAVILGGVLAYRHSVSLSGMLALVVLAAVLGDTVGYEVGKRYGERVLRLRIFAKHQATLDAARARLIRVGGRAVFLARFTAFLRAVMPGLAGTVRMPYRRFLAWNAAGGLIWGVGYTMLGYFAGASYRQIENYAGKFSELILVVIALAALIWFIRSRRRQQRAARQPDVDRPPAQVSSVVGSPPELRK
jgi:membrane protein DedA with SNARE-associated domain